MIYEGNVFQTNKLCEVTTRWLTKYLLVPFMFLLQILSLVSLLPGGQLSLSSPTGLMTGEGEGEMDMVEYLPGARDRSGIRGRSEYSDGLGG